MEQSQFKCRKNNFKVAEIIRKVPFQNIGNPILDCGKHFSKGV
jgi:hypothetical protein